MNIELQERIANMKKYLEEELKSRKPRYWWQMRVDEFVPTKDMDNGKDFHPLQPERTTVQYDFKRALISGALFFIVNALLMLFISRYSLDFRATFWMMNGIIILALFLPLLQIKRGTVMAFGKEGFCIGNMILAIPWKHLVASYIRVNDAGEDTSYYLLLYYYNETKDEFEETEYGLDGLDMSREDIASQIEYWKVVTVNNKCVV